MYENSAPAPLEVLRDPETGGSCEMMCVAYEVEIYLICAKLTVSLPRGY
jgi:hypothetical protein